MRQIQKHGTQGATGKVTVGALPLFRRDRRGRVARVACKSLMDFTCKHLGFMSAAALTVALGCPFAWRRALVRLLRRVRWTG